MDPAWARSIREECAGADVAFFMKQMTGKKPIPADLLVRQYPEGLHCHA
jgi:protein gp37